MIQECFGIIKARRDIEAGGIVQEVEQDVLVRLAREPVMGRSVVLPEGAPILGLPAFDRLGGFLKASIGGQIILEGPATHTGAVGLKLPTPMQFAGGGTIGARRFGGEELMEQLGHFGGPSRMMIAAGTGHRPDGGVPPGTGTQVGAIDLVQTTA